MSKKKEQDHNMTEWIEHPTGGESKQSVVDLKQLFYRKTTRHFQGTDIPFGDQHLFIYGKQLIVLNVFHEQLISELDFSK